MMQFFEFYSALCAMCTGDSR